MTKTHFKIIYLIALYNGDLEMIRAINSINQVQKDERMEECVKDGYVKDGELTDKADIFLSNIIGAYREDIEFKPVMVSKI